MKTAARTPTSTDEALLYAVRDGDGRTVLRTLRGCAPFGLRELRGGAAAGGAAHVAIVQTAACLLSGDETRLRVRVGAGAAVVLSDISALLAHPVGDGPETVQRIVLEVAEGGSLLFAEQPLIVAAGARLRRELRVALAPGARLLHRDTLVLGRHGELPGDVSARVRVTRAGMALLDETIATGDLAALRSPAVLGGATAIGTVSRFGADPSPLPHAAPPPHAPPHAAPPHAPPPHAAPPPAPLPLATFRLGPADTIVRALAPDVRALRPLDALLRRWTATLDQDPDALLTLLAPGAERRRLAGFGAVVLLLHVLGVGLYLAFAAGRPAFAGAGLLAYTLGLRHAFDADHIAAIDNTVRKLRGDGRCALGVGFFFSLGHSTVVLALACGIALAAGAVSGAIDPIHTVGGYVGATVSGGFLWVIGIVNLLALAGLVATTRRIWRREGDETALARATAATGTLPARLLARPLARIRSAWQMYPLGILFGLGFDTATEIGLLALSATAAGAHAPALAIVSLPLLFAAAMSLADTADSVVMSSAYGWGLRRPVRRIYFNLVVTAFSVVAALTVGGVELAQVAASALGLEGALWRWLDGLDFQLLGYAIVAAFLLTWALAAAVWRFGAIERRWDERFASAPPAASL